MTLLRDPTNAVDAKAIRVCVDRDVADAAGLDEAGKMKWEVWGHMDLGT